ncbi:hypothetical protein E8E95_07935 [Pseudomonas sp. BN414]|uniref:hypothetical protein n=1 Tax=Pseudomonas sp. BN414 TaxID=2567888 RepID=UPI002459056E|nr:hypothetical protein [Pseudomonas sp. BN414]MDH4566606.1 hypothetical protein [Pseudomonas sp. BN414]
MVLSGRHHEKAGDILFVLLKILKIKGKMIFYGRQLIDVSTGLPDLKTAFPVLSSAARTTLAPLAAEHSLRTTLLRS